MKLSICLGATSAGLGVLLIIGGAVLGWVAGPAIVKSMVKSKLDLTDPESDGYEYFVEPPVPVMVRFTFFEVENPVEVIDSGAKPKLAERGPYVYQEDMLKKDIQWTNDLDQFIEFGQYKTYTFKPEESCNNCTEDDEVRILNMPLAGLMAKAVDYGGMTGKGIFSGIQKNVLDQEVDELFPLTKVGDFLFNGIKDGAAGWMMTYSATKDRLPPVFRPENGFALFNGKQDTSENECYQVETSSESWDRHTMITKWGKDSQSLSADLSNAETCTWTGKYCEQWWPNADFQGNTDENSTCNQLRGTDGHQFPPFVNEDDQKELWIFNTVPCRSIFFRYSEKVKIEGISTLEYTVPLDGANINKTINVCTCEELSSLIANNDTCVQTLEDDPDTLDISTCPISKCYDGLQDITVCQGAPTYMSYPHFYLADAQRENFEGLQPDPEAHRTFLNVEPNTGMTLRLHSRIQLNTPVYNNKDTGLGTGVLSTNLTILQNIATVPAFPILWIDEGADIDSDPEMVKKLKNELVTPLNALNIGKWVAIGLGIALTLIGGFTLVVKPCGK